MNHPFLIGLGSGIVPIAGGEAMNDPPLPCCLEVIMNFWDILSSKKSPGPDGICCFTPYCLAINVG